MSDNGYERTFSHTLKYVRFTPESGHPFSTPAPPDPGDRQRWEIGRFMVELGIRMNLCAPGWFPGPVWRVPTGPDGKEWSDACI